MKLYKSLELYENTWPIQDIKFLRVLIKNNPIGQTWAECWKNNPEGDFPKLNLTSREETIDFLFSQIYEWDEGKLN